MASVKDVIQAIVETSEQTVPEERLHNKDASLTPEDLFAEAVQNAMESVNNGSISPYEFESATVMNFLVLAENHNFTKKETKAFLAELLA